MSEQEKKCCCENKECNCKGCNCHECESCCHSNSVPVTFTISKETEKPFNFIGHDDDALIIKKVSRSNSEGIAKLSVKYEDIDVDEKKMTMEDFDNAKPVSHNEVLAEFAEGETEKEAEFQCFDINTPVFKAEGADFTITGFFVSGLLGEEEEEEEEIIDDDKVIVEEKKE